MTRPTAGSEASGAGDLVAALDVGGTTVVGALLGPAGIVWSIRRPTPGPAGGADPGGHVLRAVAESLLQRAGGQVRAVGVGVCEYVDAGRVTSREVLDWPGPPEDLLAGIVGAAPVTVESDVRCGLLAEQRLGAVRDRRSALFVSWGTGISSALLIDGRTWPGHRGRAIALGELPGSAGSSVEGFCSGAGMASRYRTLGGQAPDARTVLAAAVDGDRRAVDVATSAGVVLADALAAAVRLTDPELVVLGGGLGSATTTRAYGALLERWRELDLAVPVESAGLGPDGPLLGAALTAGWVPDDGFSPRCGTGPR